MLVVILGPPFSGKNSVATWLQETGNFKQLKITTNISVEPNDSCFSSAEELSEYVLSEYRWKNNWVCILREPDRMESQLRVFKKRPFCFCLLIDSPFLNRYQRYSASCPDSSIEQFAQIDGKYGHAFDLVEYYDMVIPNRFPDVASFLSHLDSIQPPISCSSRLRPCWDDYFMLLADLASHRSNCMKRRVGCIIVKNRRVIATGYNGTPKGIRNCSEGGCARCNKGEARCGENLSECLCMHAEENAIIEVGRICDGATLYCNTRPCLSCTKKIIQTGLQEVVFCQDYGADGITASLFEEAGIILRKHTPNLKLIVSNSNILL